MAPRCCTKLAANQQQSPHAGALRTSIDVNLASLGFSFSSTTFRRASIFSSVSYAGIDRDGPALLEATHD